MITITISPQTAEQVQILATAMISLLQTPAAEVATVTAQAVLPPEQPAKKPKAQKAPPAIETPTEPPAAPTLEEVRAKLVAYKEKGKSLKDLFETVGCANLSAVPAERYVELLANMAKS